MSKLQKTFIWILKEKFLSCSGIENLMNIYWSWLWHLLKINFVVKWCWEYMNIGRICINLNEFYKVFFCHFNANVSFIFSWYFCDFVKTLTDEINFSIIRLLSYFLCFFQRLEILNAMILFYNMLCNLISFPWRVSENISWCKTHQKLLLLYNI